MTRPGFDAPRDDTVRRLLIPFAAAFLALDIAALALLGPVSPNDTVDHVARLYGDRPAQVLLSRLLHFLALAAAFGFFGLVAGRLRALEGGSGTLTRVAFGGLIAVVPIEIVRNVLVAAVALRYDELGAATLPLHVVAVLLGPSIAVPVTAALGALAWLTRSWWICAVAGLWALSILRLVTLSSVVWYGGLAAFVALVVTIVVLTAQLSRQPVRHAGAP